VATLMIRVHDLEPTDAADLEAVLLRQPGVFGAVVSAVEGCVEVDFEDDEGDVDEIIAEVREAGYDARLSG
jgi:copper chaperone CopZ